MQHRLLFTHSTRTHQHQTQTITFDACSTKGISYPPLSNILILQDANDPFGLLLKAAPFVIYKRNAIGDYAQFIEMYGMPSKIGKYKANDQLARTELENIFANMGANLNIVIPEEANIEFVDGKNTNANGNLQHQFIDLCDTQLAILFLGVTETTKSSASSGYAQSVIHQQSQDEIFKADKKFLLSVLNSAAIKNILKSYGYKAFEGSFVFQDQSSLAQLQNKANILQSLNTLTNINPHIVAQQFNLPADWQNPATQKPKNTSSFLQKINALFAQYC